MAKKTQTPDVAYSEAWFGSLVPYFLTYPFKNKDQSTKDKISSMLNRTSRMFEYKNVPENIDIGAVELFLQTNPGKAVLWTDKQTGTLEALYCHPEASQRTKNYKTKFVRVLNPYFKEANGVYNVEYDEDGVIMQNDTMFQSLMPLCSKYATLLSEIELSINNMTVLNRAPAILTADNTATEESVREVIKWIEDGKIADVVKTNLLSDGLASVSFNAQNNSRITDLIELMQFVRASWLNELGINSNYNMKREALNEAETGLNEYALLPLVDDMLMCRQKAIDKINEKYNTNIEIDLSSAWKKLREDGEIVEEKKEEENEMNDGGDGDENNGSDQL